MIFSSGHRKKMRCPLYLPVLMLVLCGPVSCGEDRRFEEQRLALGKQIASILVENGVCESVERRECIGGEVYFLGPINNGISVTLYAIEDKKIVNQVIEKCVNMYFNLNKKIDIHITAHKITKQEELNLNIFGDDTPYMSIHLRGEM